MALTRDNPVYPAATEFALLRPDAYSHTQNTAQCGLEFIVCATGYPLWTCPKCRRQFARAQQHHLCSVGTRDKVLKNRRDAVVALFAALEDQAKELGPVEFIARERYIILRSKHIFADVIMLADSLRLVVHLPKMARHPLFKKISAERQWVSHTAKVRNRAELEQMQPFLRAAWEYAQTY